MALNSRDVEQCWLEAQAKWSGFQDEMAKYFEPQMEDGLRMFLNELPPEVLLAVKDRDPKSFEQMRKFLGGE